MRVLSPNGIYVMLGGGSYNRVFQAMLMGPLISMTDKKMGLLLHKPNQKDLNYLTVLFEAGKVVPIIDKHFLLSEVAEAFRYYGKDLAIGKVVLTV